MYIFLIPWNVIPSLTMDSITTWPYSALTWPLKLTCLPHASRFWLSNWKEKQRYHFPRIWLLTLAHDFVSFFLMLFKGDMLNYPMPLCSYLLYCPSLFFGLVLTTLQGLPQPFHSTKRGHSTQHPTLRFLRSFWGQACTTILPVWIQLQLVLARLKDRGKYVTQKNMTYHRTKKMLWWTKRCINDG